jgi:heptosyltransferase-2
MHYRSPLLTHTVELPKSTNEEHLVVTYKKLLTGIGLLVDETKPQLFVSSHEQQEAKTRLEEFGIFDDRHVIIGINPGAAYGSAKCWPKELFQELTQRLSQFTNCRIVYFGDATGKPLVDDIVRGLSTKVVNLSGKTNLRQLMALIRQCHLFITNDSGPMHVAAAFDVPLLALFGSTNSVKTGPYGASSGVMRKNVACSPCYLRSCQIDFRCMYSITPDEVFHEAQRILHQHNHTLLYSNTRDLPNG